MSKTKLEIKNRVAYLCLNSPQNLNALDISMDEEILENLKYCEDSNDIDVIIIYGSGRAFSAGGDMNYFKHCLDNQNYDDLDKLLIWVNRVILQIKNMQKIVISAVHGHAAGGGANLALVADFLVAEDNSIFTQSFTKIGLAPDAGGMYLLSKLVGPRQALEICSSARAISAEEAKKLGFVTMICPNGSALATAEALADDVMGSKLTAVQLSKKQNTYINYSDFEEYLFQQEKNTVGAAFRSPEFAKCVNDFINKHR